MTDISWAWYLSRSSALVGFLLLYASIFLGLSIRTPVLQKIIKPAYSINMHRWVSLQALVFASVHGFSFLFDEFLDFNLANILIPFYSGSYDIIDGNILALGIIGFYTMLVLVLSSYFKKHISHSLWRALHFLNIALYIVIVLHALYLGSDLRFGALRNIFISANIFLGMLFIFNLSLRLKSIFLQKKPI